MTEDQRRAFRAMEAVSCSASEACDRDPVRGAATCATVAAVLLLDSGMSPEAVRESFEAALATAVNMYRIYCDAGAQFGASAILAKGGQA